MVESDKQSGAIDRFLLFGSPVISDDEVAEVAAVLRSGWLGRGPYVDRFEKAFARMKKAPDAVAVSSCSAALHLSLLVAGIQPGDEVITTPLTFCATLNAIIHAGARPVLVDIDPLTRNIDHRLIEAAVTERTRAIVVVHLGGRPCEMDMILDTAARHGLKVVEDCAHAIEAEYRGAPSGTLGDFGCFSFHATKNITTGEGGMVLARSPEDLERVRRLSQHGLTADAWDRHQSPATRTSDVVEIGFKYNMNDVEAALGLLQLNKIGGYWERRREISSYYDNRLKSLSVILSPPAAPHMKHAHHLYMIAVDQKPGEVNRDEFMRTLASQGVGAGVHYRSLPEYTIYRKLFGWRPEDYPNALRIGRTTVSLPLSPSLLQEDIERVTAAVEMALVSQQRTLPSLSNPE